MVALINPMVLFVMFSLQDRRVSTARSSTGTCAGRQSPCWRLGILFALMRVADQIALSMTLASYAMSVKRTAGMFSVVLGKVLYHEHHIPVRLLGSAVMLAGLLVLMQD